MEIGRDTQTGLYVIICGLYDPGLLETSVGPGLTMSLGSVTPQQLAGSL